MARSWPGLERASRRAVERERELKRLLLEGCDNAEIAEELHIAERTVKAYFNRLFIRYHIKNGIKRVKLATLLYRRELCSEANDGPRTTNDQHQVEKYQSSDLSQKE